MQTPIKISKVIGPPGTGKTTELLRLLGAAARKYDPERIGAVSFTKAAVKEMRSRAAEEAGLELKQETAPAPRVAYYKLKA